MICQDTWALSSKARNKAAHATNGNGVASQSMTRRMQYVQMCVHCIFRVYEHSCIRSRRCKESGWRGAQDFTYKRLHDHALGLRAAEYVMSLMITRVKRPALQIPHVVLAML
eukprot:3533339-Amphidinium_carterae.1